MDVRTSSVPAVAKTHFPRMVKLMRRLTASERLKLPSQVSAARKFHASLS